MPRPRSNAISGARPNMWVRTSPSSKRSDVEIGRHRIVVFSGHGSFNTITDANESLIDVPIGSSIYFWCQHGQPLENVIGKIIDSRTHLDDFIQRLQSMLGSDHIPEIVKGGNKKVYNYRLTPPTGLDLGNIPGMDDRFITRQLPPGVASNAPISQRGITLKQLFTDYADLCANASIHWAACRSIVNR